VRGTAHPSARDPTFDRAFQSNLALVGDGDFMQACAILRQVDQELKALTQPRRTPP
jgi:hypothetical protein